METFLDLAAARRSVRSYSPQEVPREVVESCIEASRLAPSACNSQPWRFVAADEAEVLEEFREAAHHRGMNAFARNAPVIIAVFSTGGNLPSSVGGKVKQIPYHYLDAGIAAEHLCLAAAEQGLGTCMIGWFDSRRVKRAAGAPAGMKPVLLITLGYPKTSDKGMKQRKPMQTVLGWNRFP